MAPWTERLLTKIKKFYVVRLLLPSDSKEQPLVTTQVYGLDHRGRLRPRQQQQKQPILKSSQSFSNSHSQSVPDSGKTEAAGSSVGASDASKPALTAAAEADKPNGDVETSLLLRSSDSADSTSSTGSSGGGGRGSGSHAPTNSDCASARCKRRSTPRVHISDSSQVTDAEAAALHKFIAQHMRRRTRRERRRHHQQPMSSLNCTTARLLELDERREQKSAAADPAPDVSVPTSIALPPPQPPVLQPQVLFTAAPIDKLQIRGVGGEEGSDASSTSRRASEELLVALLHNDPAGRVDALPPHGTSSSQPSQTRSRSNLRFTIADQAGATSSAEPTCSGRRSRRPRTPDSGVTRTITFSVARDSSRRASLKQVQGLELEPRRRRWIMPTGSDEVTVQVPSLTTSPMTTTTSSTKTVTPNGGTSVTTPASASPRRLRRRQRQRRLKLRRGGGNEPASFQPTFSRIVEWSEATNSSR